MRLLISVLFTFSFIPSISFASEIKSCPFEKACKTTSGGDSLKNFICVKSYRSNVYAGLSGNEILERICKQDTQCLKAALQDAPKENITINGKDFSVTGAFCNQFSDQNKTALTLYNPAVLSYRGQTLPIVDRIVYYKNKNIGSFIPNTEVSSLTVLRGPLQAASNFTCTPSTDSKVWSPITFHDNGMLLSCIYPNELEFDSDYGKMKAVSSSFYPSGKLKAGTFPYGLFYSITVGTRTLKISYVFAFHLNGKFRSVQYLEEATRGIITVCLDPNGTVTDEGNSISCPIPST